MRRPLSLVVGLTLACPALSFAVDRGGLGGTNPGGATWCQQHPNEPACQGVGGGNSYTNPNTTINNACVQNPQLCMGSGSIVGGGTGGGGTGGTGGAPTIGGSAGGGLGGSVLCATNPAACAGGGGAGADPAWCRLHPRDPACHTGGKRPTEGAPPPAGTPPGTVQGQAVGGGFYGPAPVDAAQSKTAGLGDVSSELEAAMRAAKARRDQPQEEQPGPDMASKSVNTAALGQQGARQREAAQLARSSRSRTEMGDYQGGLREAENAISADPENPEGYVRRAEALAMLGRYQEARDAAEKAALLMPEYANAWQNLAWADLKLGNLAAALKEIDLAISLNPDDATSWAIKAYILEQMGDLEGARKAMAKAARLDARYKAKSDEMNAGRKGYSPDMTSALAGSASAPAAAPASGAGGVPLPLVLGGLAALLAGGGAFWFLGRKKKEVGSILRPASGPLESTSSRVGKYELGRMIGRGGMGAVYEATDHALGRTVAVKKVTEELGSEAKARELLFKEARTVAALHHPAIVEIYDIFEEGKDLYVVFELVKGRTVSQILSERRRLGLQECLGILRPVCEALEFAHAQKLVHRDLKPANIMVNELGAVKLMDFGIARSVADAVPMTVSAATAPMASRTAFIIGTPAYMPPEAESGVVSQAGDVYALGVCLYEMALGQAPFPPTAGWDYKLSCRYSKPSQLDPALRSLDGLIDQALQPDPKARLSSAGAFLAGLEAAVSPG